MKYIQLIEEADNVAPEVKLLALCEIARMIDENHVSNLGHDIQSDFLADAFIWCENLLGGSFWCTLDDCIYNYSFAPEYMSLETSGLFNDATCI